MAVSISNKTMENVNCPECGYNNITKAKTCEGAKSDGSKYGKELPILVQ